MRKMPILDPPQEGQPGIISQKIMSSDQVKLFHCHRNRSSLSQTVQSRAEVAFARYPCKQIQQPVVGKMPCAPGRRRIQSFICSRESVRRWGRHHRPGRPLDMLAVKIRVFALAALADVEEAAGLIMAAAPPVVLPADRRAVGGLGQLPFRSPSSVRLLLLALALSFARPVRGVTRRLRRRQSSSASHQAGHLSSQDEVGETPQAVCHVRRKPGPVRVLGGKHVPG